MSYTPHEWITGETITANKLNNIEKGIQTSGNGSCLIKIIYPNGTGTFSKYYNFAIAEYDEIENEYNACLVNNQNIGTERVFETVTYNSFDPGQSFIIVPPLPVPNEGLVLVIWSYNSNEIWSVSGNISTETVIVQYGSTANAHIITGDCTISVTYKN